MGRSWGWTGREKDVYQARELDNTLGVGVGV